ncbi:MAG: ABC transporter substrate-binding protein [Candidatus Kariarchaeaceae archaeon]|jgi:peptide/nickel transport system substrate-binding protein
MGFYKSQPMKVILVMITFGLLVITPVAGQVDTGVERDQILWSSGYWGPPGINNPAHTLGASWESKFMYDVLFDWNPNLQEPLVGFLGESMEWNTDGSELVITLREEPYWSDGTPISADDVVYSYVEIYGGDKGPLNSLITEKIASIEKVDDITVLITVNEGQEFSKTVFFLFVGRWQIMPAHMWPQIIAHELSFGNNKYQMTVNHNEPSFPDNLKIWSGMYYPFSQAIDDSWSLYIRNDDWWGMGVLSDDLPGPKYIGMKSYPNNFAQNSEFILGEIDWFGGYIQNIGLEIDRNHYLSSYFGNQEPFFASLSSMVEVVPNHEIYPLSEHWLREAMAYSLNLVDMIDIGASGYLEPARVGRIDDRSALLADLYDPTVEEEFGFTYDLDQANAIMEENAIKVDGKWYTKTTPAELQDEYPDELPAVDGHNVGIGPYDIWTVSGWSDFELHMDTIQLQLRDMDIELTTRRVSYSEFVGASQTMTFELLLYGIGPGLLDSALNNFNYFTGPAGRGVNTTGWVNPDYAPKVAQFERAVTGSQEEKDLAFELQRMIAEALPSIPLFANGYWYSYNTEYWTGWPTEEGNEMPPMAMWAFGTTGLMQQLVMGLDVNVGNTLPTSEGQTSSANTSFLSVFSASLALMTIIVSRRKSFRT